MAKQGQGGEKTEKATPRKLRKARREGQVGNTPELGAWLGMLLATFMLPLVFRGLIDTGRTTLVEATSVIRRPDMGNALQIFHDTIIGGVTSLLPLAAVVAVIGIAGVGLQGGIWVAPKLLIPKAKKLNPLSGIKRMFGPQGAWQLVKALLKSLALGVVVYLSVVNIIPTMFGSGQLSLAVIIKAGAAAALNVLRLAALAGLIMAIADIAVVRRRNDKELKMSKYELKQEYKQSEGDPHIRGARRSRHREMSRKRMMAAVPDANVVVVNPTHVAVALAYQPGSGAPTVVAKGADHVAARIRSLAEQHRVPMVQDIPLARTLFASCEVGQEVPPDLYKAVATVLAFIMTLRSKGSAVGVHRTRTRSMLPPDAVGLGVG